MGISMHHQHLWSQEGGRGPSEQSLGSWEGVSVAVFNITLIMKFAWSTACLSHTLHWFNVRTGHS